MDCRKYAVSISIRNERNENCRLIAYNIDEIQNAAGFEEVLNAHREEEEYSIFITGPNSNLNSGSIIQNGGSK